VIVGVACDNRCSEAGGGQEAVLSIPLAMPTLTPGPSPRGGREKGHVAVKIKRIDS